MRKDPVNCRMKFTVASTVQAVELWFIFTHTEHGTFAILDDTSYDNFYIWLTWQTNSLHLHAFSLHTRAQAHARIDGGDYRKLRLTP
jgi:hypothetical protein